MRYDTRTDPATSAAGGGIEAARDLSAFVPELVWLDPEQVVCAEQPRNASSTAEVTDIARSVRTVGLSLSIITVFRNQGDDWQLVSGERRLRHARAVGLTRIPAFDLTPLPEDRRLLAQGLENTARRPLTTFEYARYVVDQKVVADIIAISQALGDESPRLSGDRAGREAQREELGARAELRGLKLHPPVVARWADVEEALDLEETRRKRLQKLAGMHSDVQDMLEPLALPQDSLLELAEWPERELRLVAEAISAADEAPTARALRLARLAALQLTLQSPDKQGRVRAKLRDWGDAGQLLRAASEVLATAPPYQPEEARASEVLTAMVAYLEARYRGRHLPSEEDELTPGGIVEANSELATNSGYPAGAGQGSASDDRDEYQDEVMVEPAHSSPRPAPSPGAAWVRVLGQLDDTLAACGRQLANLDEREREAAARVLRQMAGRIDEYMELVGVGESEVE